MPGASEILGKNILRFRELRGLTQDEFAQLLKLSRNTINRLEKGKTWVGLKALVQIAKILGVDESVLFIDPDHQPNYEKAVGAAFNAGLEQGKKEALRLPGNPLIINKPIAVETGLDGDRRDITDFLKIADRAELEILRETVDSFKRSRAKKSNPGSSESA